MSSSDRVSSSDGSCHRLTVRHDCNSWEGRNFMNSLAVEADAAGELCSITKMSPNHHLTFQNNTGIFFSQCQVYLEQVHRWSGLKRPLPEPTGQHPRATERVGLLQQLHWGRSVRTSLMEPLQDSTGPDFWEGDAQRDREVILFTWYTSLTNSFTQHALHH